MADESGSITRTTLLQLLEENPDHSDIPGLIERLEREQPADLEADGALLRGVWELRWSSARQPWLKQAPWLENLQVLDPDGGRGMNLLRLKGPLGQAAAISVIAELEVEGRQRVAVTFRRGGWIGPSFGRHRLELLASVNQSTPAWLDITVLDSVLRLCRGNAGTVFALLRRNDLEPESLLPAAAGNASGGETESGKLGIKSVSAPGGQLPPRIGKSP